MLLSSHHLCTIQGFKSSRTVSYSSTALAASSTSSTSNSASFFFFFFFLVVLTFGLALSCFVSTLTPLSFNQAVRSSSTIGSYNSIFSYQVGFAMSLLGAVDLTVAVICGNSIGMAAIHVASSGLSLDHARAGAKVSLGSGFLVLDLACTEGEATTFRSRGRTLNGVEVARLRGGDGVLGGSESEISSILIKSDDAIG